MCTRELMNQFLENHQLNKADIGMTDDMMNPFQIELVVYKILYLLPTICDLLDILSIQIRFMYNYTFTHASASFGHNL